jgi:hypothetical protein
MNGRSSDQRASILFGSEHFYIMNINQLLKFRVKQNDTIIRTPKCGAGLCRKKDVLLLTEIGAWRRNQLTAKCTRPRKRNRRTVCQGPIQRQPYHMHGGGGKGGYKTERRRQATDLPWRDHDCAAAGLGRRYPSLISCSQSERSGGGRTSTYIIRLLPVPAVTITGEVMKDSACR